MSNLENGLSERSVTSCYAFVGFLAPHFGTIKRTSGAYCESQNLAFPFATCAAPERVRGPPHFSTVALFLDHRSTMEAFARSLVPWRILFIWPTFDIPRSWGEKRRRESRAQCPKKHVATHFNVFTALKIQDFQSKITPSWTQSKETAKINVKSVEIQNPKLCNGL